MTDCLEVRALLAISRRDYDAVYDLLDLLADDELHALRSDLGELELEVTRTLEGRAEQAVVTKPGPE
jgi:hypothetical protein